MPKRNYKLSIDQAMKISEARSGDEFVMEWSKRSDINGHEILVLCYSHLPTPVSQYHNQPREFRVAAFKDTSRLFDLVIA